MNIRTWRRFASRRPAAGSTRVLSRCRAGAVIAGALSICCSGPQRLSNAIVPADESAYLEHLNEENQDGRSAYLKWISQEEHLPLSQVERRDASLSTTRNPFDAHRDARAVSRGAVIYKFHCARCHGDDAEGRGPSTLPGHPAPDFHAFDQRFASTIHRGAPKRWFKSITEGHGEMVNYPDGRGPAMPAFAGKLTREQTWLVITYLQSLDVYAPKRAGSDRTVAPPAKS